MSLFRKIQDLQAALSNSTQQLGKLNDEIENLKGETIRERENIIIKYEESAKTQNNQIEELVSESFSTVAIYLYWFGDLLRDMKNNT